MRIVAILGALALAGCASAPGATAPEAPMDVAPLAPLPDGSINFGDFRSGEPVALSRAFGAELAQRYAVGAEAPAVLNDLAKNGFSCAEAPQNPAEPERPSHECTRAIFERDCQHEWAVDLRAGGGKLRAPPAGSFAILCVGGLIVPKHMPKP